jgi:hypothetical protein
LVPSPRLSEEFLKLAPIFMKQYNQFQEKVNTFVIDVTMKRLHFGLIGVGNIAPLHARAIQAIPEAELVAVATRSAKRGRAFVEQSAASGMPIMLSCSNGPMWIL